MAFDFFEIPEHAEANGNPPSRTTHWRATGTVSESYVQAYAWGATPAVVASIYGILYRQDIRVRQSAYNQWDIQVPYGVRKNEVGNWTWDFDTTGGTIHLSNSKETIAKYPTTVPAAVGDAPDYKGAIGVDGDQVKGTDVVIPALKINVNFKHPLGVMTMSRAKYLASITGMVNNATFLTFAPGEVLFLGARGSDGSDAEVNCSYSFAMSANITGLSIGDLAGVAKKGWEVVWIKYHDDTDDVAGETKPVRVPKYAYQERVYDTVDLATALGFGA